MNIVGWFIISTEVVRLQVYMGSWSQAPLSSTRGPNDNMTDLEDFLILDYSSQTDGKMALNFIEAWDKIG